MATHCSIYAWRIPWTKEPSVLQSIGSRRVRHDSVTQHIYTRLCFHYIIFLSLFEEDNVGLQVTILFQLHSVRKQLNFCIDREAAYPEE